MHRTSGSLIALCLGAGLGLASAGEIPRDQRRSGYEQMSPATRALQDDETGKPVGGTFEVEYVWKLE